MYTYKSGTVVERSHINGFVGFIGPMLVSLLISTLSACSSTSSSSNVVSKTSRPQDGVSVGEGGPDELFAETASFEVLAQKPQRVLVGIGTADGRVLQGGSVRFIFHSDTSAGVVETQIDAPAKFLPVPGSANPAGSARIGRPSEGIGVYAATDVEIPSAGLWTIDIVSFNDKTKRLAQTAVEVKDKAVVPDIGQSAPKTANPNATSSVAKELLDSRSGPNGLGDELADPKLHQDVIDDLLAQHRPFLVVASTPTYCQSKFCGPTTDMIDAIANDPLWKSTNLAFVHLEIFAEFNASGSSRLNKWVIPWINGDGEGHEPWVFVVDKSGKIAARFDNVVTETDVRKALQQVTK
jgi:hypothetical protein